MFPQQIYYQNNMIPNYMYNYNQPQIYVSQVPQILQKLLPYLLIYLFLVISLQNKSSFRSTKSYAMMVCLIAWMKQCALSLAIALNIMANLLEV